MFIRSNYKILDQSIDLFLGRIEDGNLLKELKNGFRKILFENEVFLLEESREKTIGIHAETEGAGASMYQQDENWVINLGFSNMNLIGIEEMASLFGPLEKLLEGFKGDLAVTLVYLQEGRNGQENKNCFLKEVVLTLPESFIKDEIWRIFKIRRFQESTAYTFKSLKKDLLSFNEGVALLQKEKINAEEVFISSLDCWLNSVKELEPITDKNKEEINCANFVFKNKSSH